jgi:Ser/Thr protein kinase RdoA (MazF antagonist)
MERRVRLDNVAAAVRVARDLGIDVGEPVVLRDLGTTLVHLAPSPVVARAWAAGRRDPVVVEHEIGITTYLADRGARVAPPYGDPGPHRSGDHVVTLWNLLDHDRGRPLDGHAAGRALREIHELLAEPAAAGFADLPHFARLEEASDVVAELEVTPDDRAGLDEMLALAAVQLPLLDLPFQPLHGDAWLGNVLRTPGGPVWTDFEFVCRGPREVDVATNEAVADERGRAPADDDFLAGYGAVERDLVEAVTPLSLVPFVAWTYRLAGEQPERLPIARSRLVEALAGLRRATG